MSDSVREHLERFVFEVYGAEEGKRKLDELIKKEEEHAKSMKGLAEQAKKAAKDEADAAKKSADAQKKRAEDTEEAFKKIGAASAALIALAIKANADLEASTGQVERQLKKTGATQMEMTRAINEARAAANRLGIGALQADDMLGQFAATTGSATKASEDFRLALNIQAAGQVDVAQATDLLTRTRKGEIAELIKLDGFNRDNIKALEAIEDRTTRAEVAMRMLRKEYDGAGEALKGTNDDLNSIKETATELLAILGDSSTGLVNSFAQFFGVIDGGESLLGQFAGGLQNFKNQASNLADFILEFSSRKASGDIPFTMSIGEFRDLYNLEQGNAALRSKRDNFAPGMGMVDDPYANDAGTRWGEGETPKSKTKKKGGKRKDPDFGGFTGAFADGGSGQTLEEAAGEEGQAEQERLDRLATFQNNREQMEREHQKRVSDIQEKAADQRALAEAAVAKEALEAKEKQQKAALAAAEAGAVAGAQLAQSFIKDEGAKAVISGSLEVARSIAAFASQNYGGSIAHAAAATQFFATAAKAGMGGATGKMQKASPPSVADARQQQRRDADLANSPSIQRDNGTPLIIQYRSLWPPSPQQVKDTRRMLEADSKADV